MDLDTLKKRLQDHFTDGLVAVVGSGLSVAEGIPGMGQLADHLLATIPKDVPPASYETWEKIELELKSGQDLESALLKFPGDSHIEAAIVRNTAHFLLDFEKQVFEDVLVNGRVLRFSRLLRVMRKEPNGIPVITTNYDRLIELAAEAEGIGVDSSFVGHRLGAFDPKGSRMSLCRDVSILKKRPRKEFCDHIRLFKPHGSFDWYSSDKGPIRCALDISGRRLMITPGGNKYLTGYEPPFDRHIGTANEVIDRGSRFLFVGYGFNDAHLQTHITPRMKHGDPAIIITRSLSENAKTLLPQCRGSIAITRAELGNGTAIITHNAMHHIPGVDLWDVNVLVQEVWKR